MVVIRFKYSYVARCPIPPKDFEETMAHQLATLFALIKMLY